MQQLHTCVLLNNNVTKKKENWGHLIIVVLLVSEIENISLISKIFAQQNFFNILNIGARIVKI